MIRVRRWDTIASMGRLRAVLVAAIVALGTAALAGPTAAQQAQARELVNKAIAKSQAGDHAGAIELYRQAYALVPVPVLLSNIGAEYEASDKPVEAMKSFCEYLDADPTGANASYARAQAKALAPKLGRSADEDPCKPAPATPPPPPPDGGPELGTGSGSGSDVGTGSGTTTTTTGTAATPPNGQLGTTASATPAPAKSPLPTAGLIVGGIGVAAFGAGVYFGIDGKNISDFITNYTMTHPNMMWPDDIQKRQQRGELDNTLQTAFMISGGVAVAAGAVMYFVGRSHHTDEHVAILPSVSPTSAGLVATGRF